MRTNTSNPLTCLIQVEVAVDKYAPSHTVRGREIRKHRLRRRLRNWPRAPRQSNRHVEFANASPKLIPQRFRFIRSKRDGTSAHQPGAIISTAALQIPYSSFPQSATGSSRPPVRLSRAAYVEL